MKTPDKITRKARSITADFILADYGAKQVVAEFTVGHSRDRKCFYSSLSQVTVEDRGTGFISRSYMLFSGVRPYASQRVARFSQKALEGYYEEALAATLALLEDEHPEVVAKFTVEEAMAA